MVFGHPDTPNRLHKLNTLTHTYIMAKVKEMTEKYRKEGAVPFCWMLRNFLKPVPTGNVTD